MLFQKYDFDSITLPQKKKKKKKKKERKKNEKMWRPGPVQSLMYEEI